MNTLQNTLAEIEIIPEIQRKVDLVEIQRDGLRNLAELVTNWQSNPKFMRFLKERPMSMQENWLNFLLEINSEKTVFLGITLDGVADLVGFLLFHNFDQKSGSLELGFRIDPQNQSRGVCTQAVKESLSGILQRDAIEEIVGRHSAFNVGSFNVFKHSGFEIEKFVPQQTFLPNIMDITDDFKRRISNELLANPQTINPQNPNKSDIVKGLHKHNLSLTT